MTHIRKAGLGDVGAIQTLNAQLFQHDYQFDSSLLLERPWSKTGEQYFIDRITDEEGGIWVAEDSNIRITGYLAGALTVPVSRRMPMKRAELENMFVLPEARRQGIGRILVQQFTERAKNKGATVLYVEASAGNKEALAFYEACGLSNYIITLEQDL